MLLTVVRHFVVETTAGEVKTSKQQVSPGSGSFVSSRRISSLRVYMYVCYANRFSPVHLSATPWTEALQAPLSMGLSGKEYWSELPRPLPGDLPDPGIEPASLMFPALVGGFFTTSATWEAHVCVYVCMSIYVCMCVFKLFFIEKHCFAKLLKLLLHSFQLLSRVWFFVTPWTAACQASCPSPTPRVYPNPCPLSW